MKIAALCTILLTGILYLFMPLTMAYANTNFDTHIENQYIIIAPNQAHVVKTFTITNRVSTEYLSRYAIVIDSDQIQNVLVSDTRGTIPATVNQVNNTTAIGIEFSDKVVGKDQSRIFTIEYDQTDLGTVTQQTADIFIPPVQDPNSVTTYNTTLLIPPQYGMPIKVLPEFFTTAASASAATTVRLDNQGKEEGITLLFGKQQTYSFSIVYKLKNTATNQSIIQLPLPPDTTHQRVTYTSIEPTPNHITKDNDGNWIATYENASNQIDTIKVHGLATLFADPPDTNFIPLSPKHTHASEFWPTHEHALIQTAKKVTTVRDILQFMKHTFHYNYERQTQSGTRIGPTQSLAQPSNLLAQDFADMFVSLARINQIPSRTAIGFAVSRNAHTRPTTVGQTDFHAWAEYFSQESQQWVSVDPAWHTTTGGRDISQAPGLHRIVLAYQGESSTQPIPAGVDDQSALAMESFIVSEASAPAEIPLHISVKVKPKVTAFLGIGDPHEIEITNTTPRAWHHLPLTLNHSSGFGVQANITTLPDLLPYQTISIPITITSGSIFQSAQGELRITIGGQNSTHQVTVGALTHQLVRNPFILSALGTIVFSLVLSAIIIYARHRNREARRQKKKKSK